MRHALDAARLRLHGWHYMIELGEVQMFNLHQSAFVRAVEASHSGTKHNRPYVLEHDAEVITNG